MMPGDYGVSRAEAEWTLEAGAFARRLYGCDLGSAADCARDHAASRRSRYLGLGAMPGGGADAWRRAGCAWVVAAALHRWGARACGAGARAARARRVLPSLRCGARPHV